MASTYVQDLKKQYNQSSICSVENPKKAVQDADIIVTVTPSRKPLIFSEWIQQGTHINCMGADAPGKQELDPTILVKSKLVIDDWEQSHNGGEINIPFSKGIVTQQDVWGDICEIVAGVKAARTSSEELTVFSSTGLAIQDAAAANVAYQNALKEKMGKYVDVLNI